MVCNLEDINISLARAKCGRERAWYSGRLTKRASIETRLWIKTCNENQTLIFGRGIETRYHPWRRQRWSGCAGSIIESNSGWGFCTFCTFVKYNETTIKARGTVVTVWYSETRLSCQASSLRVSLRSSIPGHPSDPTVQTCAARTGHWNLASNKTQASGHSAGKREGEGTGYHCAQWQLSRYKECHISCAHHATCCIPFILKTKTRIWGKKHKKQQHKKQHKKLLLN